MLSDFDQNKSEIWINRYTKMMNSDPLNEIISRFMIITTNQKLTIILFEVMTK